MTQTIVNKTVLVMWVLFAVNIAVLANDQHPSILIVIDNNIESQVDVNVLRNLAH